jgi:hypothetical protein
MLKELLARVPFLRNRKDQLKVDSAERREAWNQVIAEHQKPLEKQPPPK